MNIVSYSEIFSILFFNAGLAVAARIRVHKLYFKYIRARLRLDFFCYASCVAAPREKRDQHLFAGAAAVLRSGRSHAARAACGVSHKTDTDIEAAFILR